MYTLIALCAIYSCVMWRIHIYYATTAVAVYYILVLIQRWEYVSILVKGVILFNY